MISIKNVTSVFEQTSRNPGVAATPSRSKFNLVGPRDYKSNIRKIIYAKPKDENTTVRSSLCYWNNFFNLLSILSSQPLSDNLFEIFLSRILVGL